MKKYKPQDLEDAIETVCSISCSKCKSDDGAYNTDEFYASQDLFKKGWRATDKNIYCPKCAKKYLKQ